jgi:glycosyltransferase involved in cell wall biosynthesis
LSKSTNRGKKVIVISNFHEDNSISRSNMVFKYFTDRNFDAIVLYSNFSHSLRAYRYFENKKFISLSTIGYQSSLSINRILSHFIYSLQVFRYLMKSNANIIYVILPPNWLTLIVLFKLTKRIKIIVDVLDLWPEAFPHNNIVTKLILSIIGVIPKISRGIAVKNSDYCITESDYFFKKLNLISKENSKTVYIKKFESKTPTIDQVSEEFSIGYLGNIGHIYDFDSLFKIMLGIQKRRKVILHIIGSGPNREWLLKKLKNDNLPFIDHGISFDENFKKNIFSKCWFGFNGYKESTEVALSYKSVDYLSYGLPLLNSAKEDTNRLVLSDKIGFNYNKDNLESLIKKLSTISSQEVIPMKKNSYRTFQQKFSQKSFYSEMDVVAQTL